MYIESLIVIFSNKEIINGTINWSSTSEGSDYWFGLYVNTKK